MKRILLNATKQEEMRVALVDGQQLLDMHIRSPQPESKKANIYKGRITRIEPSLEAAFVDYGTERHGFLPLKEIAREYFPDGYTYQGRPTIKEVLTEGQEVIVQAEKEEHDNKGVALTTYICLAGSYLVLMPNNPRAGGISRRIEGDDRTKLLAALSTLELPPGMGLIVRNAGIRRNGEDLKWDLSMILNHWTAIKKAADSHPAPFMIHQESDVFIRAIRDYLHRDIDEIIINSNTIYERALEHINLIHPELANRVKKYEEKTPIFNHFNIDRQFESMRKKKEAASQDRSKESPPPAEGTATITKNSVRQNKNTNIERHHVHKTEHVRKTDHVSQPFRLGDLGSKFLYWLFGR